MVVVVAAVVVAFSRVEERERGEQRRYGAGLEGQCVAVDRVYGDKEERRRRSEGKESGNRERSGGENSKRGSS